MCLYDGKNLVMFVGKLWILQVKTHVLGSISLNVLTNDGLCLQFSDYYNRFGKLKDNFVYNKTIFE